MKLNQPQLIKPFLWMFFIFFGTNFSVGQHIYWTDFVQTTSIHEQLVFTTGRNIFGTAESQNTIYNRYDWVAEYPVSFHGDSKVWGIIAPATSISLANMELGFHISSQTEGIITVFFQGETVYELEVDPTANNVLKIEKIGGYIYMKINGNTVFSEGFDNYNSYNFMAMLKENTKFNRMTFSTGHQEVFVAEYDTLTTKGSIQVNLPYNAPSGPYHYLLGKEDYVDLNEIHQAYIDSAGIELQSSFFDATNNNDNYLFENLRIGEYYVSVLDDNLQEIDKQKVFINPKIEPLSNSDFVKEGDLFVAGANSAYSDFPIILTTDEQSSATYGVELFDVVSEQNFGFGIDSIIMSGVQDILYGFQVKDQEVFLITNGNLAVEGVSVQENDELILQYNDGIFNYYINDNIINSIEISGNLIDDMVEYDMELNLKHEIARVGKYSRPFYIYEYNPLYYSLDIDVNPIDCLEETGSVDISFGAYNSFLFEFDYVEYEVKDESDNIIGGQNPTNLQNLSPGIYWVTGNVYFTSNHQFFPNPQPKVIDEYFVIGYPIEWVNKIDTDYDDTDESLTRVGNILVNPLGYAATNNNILDSGTSWVDFKINYETNSFWQYYEWALSPINQFSSNAVLFACFGGSLSIATNNSLDPITSFSPSHDRFRIEYDGSYITVSRNRVIITGFSATPTDYKRLNVFLDNLDESIYDVYTNMDCEKTPIYAKVERKLRGVKYKPINKKVYFYYGEEYLDDDGDLNYRVVDEDRTDVIDGSSQNLIDMYGDNRCSIDVASLATGSYLLEVQNDKKELFYLRFIID
ncbi:MAG: hypothetical protein WED10_00050 [Brumimicrobium sp.]